MKNIDTWKPTKFVYRNGKLVGSRRKNELSVSSRLVADIIARYYDNNLRLHVKGKLVDLGCGKAPLYHAYKSYATEVVCADWANSVHENPHLDHVVNLNEPLPFPDNTFDTILLSDVMEHLSNPDLLWKEMYRILRAHGKVILNVPFFYKLHEVPYDFFRYTEFALKNFAERNNFKIETLEPMGGAPEILSDIAAKVVMGFPGIGNALANFIQSACTLFLRTGVGKKLSRKTSRHFPLAYFMVVTK